MVDIRIDPEQVQGFVEKAILDSLTPEAREQVLAQAVRSLLEPVKSTSAFRGGTASPLQQAFTNAVSAAAHKVVMEQVLNDPEVRDRIVTLLGPLVATLGNSDDFGLAEAIGSAVGRGITDYLRSRG